MSLFIEYPAIGAESTEKTIKTTHKMLTTWTSLDFSPTIREDKPCGGRSLYQNFRIPMRTILEYAWSSTGSTAAVLIITGSRARLRSSPLGSIGKYSTGCVLGFSGSEA